MAKNNITVDVSVTGLDVPLMIVVDKKGGTKVFEHGKQVENLKQIYFRANIGKLPTYTLDTLVK